jgi:peptidoglycan hydrolase-like protein with peptidoglycan-binding domain
MLMAPLWWTAGAAAQKKSAPAKAGKKATAKAASKAPQRKTTARKTTRKRARRPAVTWRNRQLAPTPERYKEIQQALATKGYLKPEEADGRWDAASIEALKKFQAEQNLAPTGKLNSLSLIALGLGPRYEPVTALPPAALP